MTNSQLASNSWCQAPRPDFCYCHTLVTLSMWGALSDEEKTMSPIFTVLHVGILHRHLSSVPCGYLLFTVLQAALIHIYVQYI
jgi:hypothetical protein